MLLVRLESNKSDEQKGVWTRVEVSKDWSKDGGGPIVTTLL